MNETFDVAERQSVLDIPLPSTWKCDTQYWWPTNDGNYTVRSGYWLGRMGHVHTWDLFFGRRERDIWKLVWKIAGAPKLCHFIWRTCKGSLGVMDVLYRRHIREHSTCPVCGGEEETIIHALFNCTYASEIWLHSNFQGMLMEAPRTSFAERFMWLVGRLDSEELASFGALVWAVWFCRNQRVFEGDAGLNAVATAAGFSKLKVDYGMYKNKVCGLSSSPRLVIVSSWQPPPQSYVKVNVDAHVMHGNGVSMGMIIRDEHGSIKAAGVKRIASNWAPELAEAGAARFGLDVARRLGFDRVVLECDASNVVRCIRERRQGAAPIFLFYDDILEISSSFLSFDCVHVKRAGNTVAHSVARWEADVNSETICTSLFPQSLQTLVELDLI